jgi:uncharacterized membrane protein
MLKNIFFFAFGFLVARYIILNTTDYKAQESETIDKIRNNVHDLIKKYAPEADDTAIGADVIATIPDNSNK